MNENRYSFFESRQNGWYGLVIMAVLLVLLFFLVKSLFKILYFLSPLLVVLTLIFDYRVFIRYFNMLVRMFRRNWVFGLALVVLTIVGFPLVAGGLCFNAFMNWRIKRARKRYGIHHTQEKGKFSEYELLEEGEELELKPEEKIRRQDEHL